MQNRKFSMMRGKASIIGQGTWTIDQGERKAACPPCHQAASSLVSKASEKRGGTSP